MRVYAHTLRGLSGSVLAAVVAHALQHHTFCPKPVELRDDIEVVRKAWLAAHSYRPCERCEGTPGWVETVAAGTVEVRNERGRLEHVATPEATRQKRCSCFEARQQEQMATGLFPAPPSMSVTGGFTSAGGLSERFRQRLRILK